MRRRCRLICPMVLAGWWGLFPAAADDYHDDPIARYERRQVAGFAVLVSPRLRDHPAEAAAGSRELADQLERIARVVPARPLAELRKVRIWLEWRETDGLGEFHWGPDILRRQGRNVEKSRGVEVTNARHLVEWADHQPWALLHELAHAYHCTVLGETHAGVEHAYDRATRSGMYDLVDYARGGRRVAYARRNKFEYFAELSEAYFGRNDFEPATRDRLEAFDPVGYQLMVDAWGRPVPPAAAAPPGGRPGGAGEGG